MSIFKPINENEASDKVKKVFEDIKSSRKIEEVPIFWKYIYDIGNISNEKITQFNNSFKKTSEEILISFFKESR